jgi:PAS domain S-box-containing protein
MLFDLLKKHFNLFFANKKQLGVSILKYDDFYKPLNKNFNSLGYWEYNIDKQIIRWSEDVYDIFDLPLEYSPTLNKMLELFEKQSKVRLNEAIQKAIYLKSEFTGDFQFTNNSNQVQWLKISAKAIDINKNTLLKGCIQNNSVLKIQELNLQLYNELLNESDDAVIVAEKSGKIKFSNQKAAELYGLSVNELQSLNIQNIDDNKNDDYQWEHFYQKLSKKGAITQEFSLRSTDGIQLPMEEHAHLIEINSKNYIVSFIKNNSEKKKAEQKIKKDLELQQILSDISFLMNTSDEFGYKVREMMRITGNNSQASRVFIFEDFLNGKAVSNTYEWCKRGIEPQLDNLQAIPYSLFPEWLDIFNTQGRIEVSDLQSLPESIVSVFQQQNTASLLAFPLIIDNKYKGFIGISEAYKQRVWEPDTIEFMQKLSNIVSNTFEQKQAIDSLRKSERRFREFAELLPEMVLETSINGKLTFANLHACERIGITNENLQSGLVFFSLFIESERLHIWDNIEKLLHGEKIENEEYHIISRDGLPIPVIVYVNRIMRDQLPVGLRAIMVDISARKNSEKQIVSLAKFAEESPYPILRIESNGSISYCNRIGASLKEFVEKNYETSFKDILSIIFETGNIEEFEININGIYYSLTLTPIKEYKYVNIYAKDITQKRIDEEKLLASEQRFRDVAEASGEYVWETDLMNKYTYLTPKVEAVLGFEPNEMIGRTPFEFMPTDEAERMKAFFDDYSLHTKSFVNIQHLTKQKSGKVIWQQLSGIPIFDNNRRFTGFRGTGLDVSQQKKYENELRDAKLIAEEASKIKADFLSTMSHEIRTPMNAVIGLTYILLQEIDTPEQKETLNTLKFSAENLMVLINDILDFSKIEAGKITFEETDFNPFELLKSIFNTFISKTEEKQLAFTYNFQPEIPLNLLGDPVRLAQILNNLVSNAVKFTDSGSVQINAKLLASQADYAVIQFEVLDTGIGISDDQIYKIFESFTQASSDITRKFGGTGLGLAISRKLIEMQGGKLEVESTIGKGSRFFFYIRYKMGNPDNISLTNTLFSGHFESFNNLKVLVVEDNSVNQLVARKFLEKWNIIYTIVDNGKKAIEAVQKQDFDLILMDLQMPVLDGYEASKVIRSLTGEKYQKIPIIALTASVLDDVQIKVKSSGMDDLILKPFNPGELYSKIRKYSRAFK